MLRSELGGTGLRQSNGHAFVDATIRVVWAHRKCFPDIDPVDLKVEQEWHFSACCLAQWFQFCCHS